MASQTEPAANAFVASNATMVAALPMDEVALVGVAGPEKEMHAYLRFPEGRIERIDRGQPMALGTPLEIGPAGVVLELSNGNATFLPPYPYGADPPPA
ncbi:MAG: hypothetical protein CSA74_01665 [Rhodobacterales bacterium]|nr:MAG: hypothetical protein CSA74_01665 [Rhodobacterales bacterium]